ncbi:MAG TPA: hypothetical protein VFX05_14375, partial [Casimicrobiaceae bacterium]|nr:hypothetical protein [Casimicrobiaceae bacterium]
TVARARWIGTAHEAAASRTFHYHMRPCHLAGILLTACVAAGACAPMATKEGAVVRTEAFIHPPLLGLDFWSTELHIVDVDGRPVFVPVFYNQALAPGLHAVTVEVWKGPTGLLGVAPLLGRCRGRLAIDAAPEAIYAIRFQRGDGGEFLQAVDLASGTVVDRVPCTAWTPTGPDATPPRDPAPAGGHAE